MCLRAQVRVNELQCTRAANSSGESVNGDWLELYNAGKKPVALGGYILSMDGRMLHLDPRLSIGPKGRCVLWCDHAPGLGPDHLELSLPRTGGTLLLVAPGGTSVLDVFQWPAMPPGTSVGRLTDGANDRGFFAAPSPGLPNNASMAVSGLLLSPSIICLDGTVEMRTSEGAFVRYTLDGSLPTESSPVYTDPLRIPAGTVLRARSFGPDALPSDCSALTTEIPDTAWALMVAPGDLEGTHGITDRPSGNNARKGKEWQRQAWLQQGAADVGSISSVGISIAGSGSRSLPKTNFKLSVRDRFGADGPVTLPDGTAWNNVFLRADATPHAFLRNAFMEEVARRSGEHVDVQPGFPVPLYLNGRYEGLYRALPGKGVEWIRALNRDGPVDIIEGPGAKAVSGSDKPFLSLLQTMSDGRSLDGLDQTIDVASLIDLACFDLWSGRADHDLNVRCWRPRTPDGRWRWVMYDMDLWAPVDDRTVQRMCGSVVPETPFIPRLLGDGAMRDRLLARTSALLATTLSPGRAGALADSLYNRYHEAMERDHDRWVAEMDVPTPDASRTDLMDHVAHRNGPLMAQLARYTGTALRFVAVQVEPKGAGTVEVEGLALTDDRRDMKVFGDVPLHFRAFPAEGMEFAGWKGEKGEGGSLTLMPLHNMRITAMFRPVGVSEPFKTSSNAAPGLFSAHASPENNAVDNATR